MQRHLGVGAAGDRVAALGGGLLGVRRVGDVPTLDRAVVDAGGQQRAAVGCPPVAAEPVHLLGGDELRDAPGDLLLLTGGQHLGLRTVHGHDVQGALGGVRHPGAGRVGARVDDRAGGRGSSRTPPSPTRSATQSRLLTGERRDGGVAVGGVADDAACTLAAALAPRPLRGGQLLVPAARAARAGRRPASRCPVATSIDHSAPDRVRAVPGPDEQQPAAGRVEEQAARSAAGEPLGAGVLAGEGAGSGGAGEGRVGHPLNLPTDARAVAATR